MGAWIVVKCRQSAYQGVATLGQPTLKGVADSSLSFRAYFQENVMQDINSLGIRRLGIVACFHSYHSKHGRFPANPKELNEVTTTLLPDSSFKKYQSWFLDSEWRATPWTISM